MIAKINFAPDAPTLEARHIDRLIDHFLADQAQRLDPETVRCNGYRFKRFLDWWAEEGPRRGWLLDETGFHAFAQHLATCESERGGPLSWHSRNDALRRLRQMLRWAHQRGYVPLDFSGMVPSPKGAPTPRKPVDLSMLARMVKACDRTNEPERNRAILAVLGGTGVRSEECATLRVEDVTLHADGTGYVQLSVAKNDKLRIVAFDAATGKALRAWMERLPYAQGPLFPSRTGRNRKPRPLTPSGLYKILVAIAEIAGVAFAGAHDLRRCFATLWARAGAPPDLLQRQLGHSSVSTTSLYVLNDIEGVRAELSRRPLSPFAQVSGG